ncbi:MAG: glycosyl hydrolase family 28-related protein [Planctomycetota bacterium]
MIDLARQNGAPRAARWNPASLPPYGLSVADIGAIGDGAADDAPAIQAALDRKPPVLVVPPGTYRIGRTLRLPAGAHVLAHPAAEFVLADGAGVDDRSFLVTNEGGADDITIEGGCWNGNNPGNPRGPDGPGGYTGVPVSFHRTRRLKLIGLTVRDPESYFIRLGQVRHFRVEDVTLEARHLRPNQDGVHLGGGCEDGEIRGIRGVGIKTPNDDMIAINADDALHRVEVLGLVNAPIRRLRIEDIKADDCHSFVRMLSVWSCIEYVQIRDVAGGCRISAINLDAARDARVTLFDIDDEAFAGGVGRIQNVRATDMCVFKSADAGASPLLDLRTRCEDVTIERFTRDEHRDTRPDAPTAVLAACPDTRLTVGGLNETQARDIASAPSLRAMHRQIGCEARAIDRYRADICMDGDDQFRIERGGFESMQLNHDFEKPSATQGSDATTKGGVAATGRQGGSSLPEIRVPKASV